MNIQNWDKAKRLVHSINALESLKNNFQRDFAAGKHDFVCQVFNDGADKWEVVWRLEPVHVSSFLDSVVKSIDDKVAALTSELETL